MKKTMGPTTGLALLELMFAAGIIALVLSLLFGALLNMSIVGSVSEGQALAVSRVASVSEELQRRTTMTGLLSYVPPSFGGLGVAEQIQVSCFDTTGTKVNLPTTEDSLANPIPNPVEVQIAVTWRDTAGHVYTVTGSTKVER